MTHHRLRRDSLDTYNGGNYCFRHSIQKDGEKEWVFLENIYARSLQSARAQIDAQSESFMEWRTEP